MVIKLQKKEQTASDLKNYTKMAGQDYVSGESIISGAILQLSLSPARTLKLIKQSWLHKQKGRLANTYMLQVVFLCVIFIK